MVSIVSMVCDYGFVFSFSNNMIEGYPEEWKEREAEEEIAMFGYSEPPRDKEECEKQGQDCGGYDEKDWSQDDWDNKHYSEKGSHSKRGNNQREEKK